MISLEVSNLNKTWIIDIDGTIFLHNFYLHGQDKLVNGFLEFYNSTINKGDVVILVTSRKKEHALQTKKSLEFFGIKFSHYIDNLPIGERIIINDRKPSGLLTAHAININRDDFTNIKIHINDKL
jgi:hypothetical protein